MLKSIEVQGKTEDEAIEIALEQLGLSRDDVSVEILETAKTGLFGLKNTPAIVKVEYDSDEASLPVTTAKKSKPAVGTGSDKRSSSRDTAPADEETKERISVYLKGLFEHMDLDVSFSLTDVDGAVNVTLTAADPGVLIGRRGETLDALQHLTNYSVNRNTAGRVRVHLDAENYRQRRSDSLESLAHRTASKVVKYRRNVTLDPMNAYERHIVHCALQDHSQVSTFSIGNDANRRVVIAYGQNKEGYEHADSPQFKEWH